MDNVKKLIDIQGRVDRDEVLAYLKNDKVKTDPEIVKMLMRAPGNKYELLSSYLMYNDTKPNKEIIDILVANGLDIEGDELGYYLGHSDNIDIEIVKKLLPAVDRDERLLHDYLNNSKIVPQNNLIKLLMNAGFPLAVDEFIQYQGNEPVNDIEKDPDRPLFVAVGRINYQKGFDLLLEAAHMLEEDGYKFDVVVIGGKENWGDEYKRIMRSMDRLHIQNVKFIGLRSNPQKYMKMADWLLSTSIFEGYSLVSQEAAILGTPLLLTDCSGVRELVGDNEYGLVMEPSVKGIYEGMKKVLDDPSLQKHYKEKILERRKIIDQDQRFREIEEMLFSE